MSLVFIQVWVSSPTERCRLDETGENKTLPRRIFGSLSFRDLSFRGLSFRPLEILHFLISNAL